MHAMSTKRRPASRTKRTQGTEWVGGRLRTPFYVKEAEPYRPEAMLWLELPERIVVGWQLIDPAGPSVSFAASLEQAMRAPIEGPPRRPARIRVPDTHLADELKRAVPGIEVAVAPVPELHELMRLMAETMPASDDEDGEHSYFEDGRVSLAAIESLFAAARVLFTVAPWKTAADMQVLRVDIPALGVEGACLSIIGALGESLGFILFPSHVGFEGFLEAMDAGGPTADIPDLGSDTLALNFERGADLPPGMRREVTERGWPVAAANAYPWVLHRDREGLLRPLAERDVQIVAATASALAAFFVEHSDAFRAESFEPICESWFANDDLEVRFTAPYEAASLFAVDAEPLPFAHTTPKVGRNAPCPCGSGRKYKKCCLPREQAEQAARASR
jgi:hypothetical protein